MGSVNLDDVAPYTGTCDQCGEPFEVGYLAFYDPNSKEWLCEEHAIGHEVYIFKIEPNEEEFIEVQTNFTGRQPQR